MFNRLLPERIDNTYRGHVPGLWLFGLVVAAAPPRPVVNLTLAALLIAGLGLAAWPQRGDRAEGAAPV